MTAFLSNIWSKIAFVAVFVGLLLVAVFKLIATGRKAERADRAKADQVVRDRVDAVRPPEAGETEKSLREGQF